MLTKDLKKKNENTIKQFLSIYQQSLILKNVRCEHLHTHNIKFSLKKLSRFFETCLRSKIARKAFFLACVGNYSQYR